MKALARPLPKKAPPIVTCPSCQRRHCDHPEYGAYCCLSCLQLAIRPLIPKRLGGI
jgi:hypothetical protein